MKFQLSFNPSQVQFTREIVYVLEENEKPFQSLTGSIHTLTGVNPGATSKPFQSLTGSIHTPGIV